MSVSHHGEPLVSFVSVSWVSPNSACLCPIATKEFEYRRFWWSAKKSDCTATTKERPNMPPFFPRRPRRHRRWPCTANPIRRLLLLPLVALITNVASLIRLPFSPLKEISRLFQFPLILPADRQGIARGDPLFYTEPRISYGCVGYTDSRRISKSLVTIHVRSGLAVQLTLAKIPLLTPSYKSDTNKCASYSPRHIHIFNICEN